MLFREHTRLPWPSLSPRVCSNPCPLSQWCYLTISSSATLFFCLNHEPNIPVSYAILLFTASDFHHQTHPQLSIISAFFTTRHIHNWASFLLWPNSFILSEAICNCPLLFPSSILDTFCPGGPIFQCPIFVPFHTIYGVLTARIPEWFALPPPRDHVSSELFSMTCPSWVAPHGMAYSFIKLHKPLCHSKTVIHKGCLWEYWG